MQSFYHIDYIYKVSVQSVLFYDIGDNSVLQRLYHMVSLQYVLFYDIGDDWVLQRLYHNDYIHRVSLHCDFLHACNDN